MEYYMLLATDADDVHEARMGARAGHLQRLEALKAEGRLQHADNQRHGRGPYDVFGEGVGGEKKDNRQQIA